MSKIIYVAHMPTMGTDHISYSIPRCIVYVVAAKMHGNQQYGLHGWWNENSQFQKEKKYTNGQNDESGIVVSLVKI